MEVINLSGLDEPKSTIPGIELLMNDKKRVDKGDTITLSDIDKLENELNSLTKPPEVKFDLPPAEFPRSTSEFPRSTSEFSRSTSEFSRSVPDVKITTEPVTVKFDVPEIKKDPSSWDGFKQFKGDPDKPPPAVDSVKEKFTYLRKLEDLENKGVRLSKKYTMDSSLDEMKGEYENIIDEKERTNNVKFQGKMLMACITGIEYLNAKVDPFDIKLDGWAEQVNENLSDYDEIFAELYDKYKSKAKLAPELKLLFQLAGSGIMLHMTNTMFKSSMPGMDDIMRQNPELMQKFTQAAMSSMGSTKPGFTNFMNTVQPPKEDKRPDMKGPSDINDILSGLKPKTVQMDEGSTVSISELNEMKDGLNMAKRARRKKSDKTTINLDI
jgi:hypothetical protein